MSVTDPTRIEIDTDPTSRRMRGVATHGKTPFDVPFVSEIAYNLWQGGCERGLVLPPEIQHVVSLYPWERYRVTHEIDSELYVRMYDAEDQGIEQVDQLARWVNECRDTGPVLVHCQAGLNRSSLVAARALFIGDDGHPSGADRAAAIVAYLRERRSPAVLCNKAFEGEVLSWK